MRRREFITLVGIAAVARPHVSRAKDPEFPVIGILSGNRFDDRELAAVRRGLAETGYVEDRNVAMEFRSAEGRYDRLAALATDLVGRRVAAIVAIGGTVSAVAAKAATSAIPIVFANGGDPIASGLVPALNRPGGNVTGVSFFVTTLGAKRLGLLREMVPSAEAIGFLANPGNPTVATETEDVRNAAQATGARIHVRNARLEGDIEVAFADFAERRINALIVAADAFFLSRRAQLAGLALQHKLPMMCDVREHAVAGSLTSYGTDRADAYRQAGVYAGKVLKGERPADLPVMQSTKFEFVINLTTAKALGIEVPPMVLARADGVIE